MRGRPHAIAAITPESGRYQFGFVEDFTKFYAQSVGVSDEQRENFCRIQRAAALHRHELYLAEGELCDRRSWI